MRSSPPILPNPLLTIWLIISKASPEVEHYLVVFGRPVVFRRDTVYGLRAPRSSPSRANLALDEVRVALVVLGAGGHADEGAVAGLAAFPAHSTIWREITAIVESARHLMEGQGVGGCTIAPNISVARWPDQGAGMVQCQES